MHGLGGRVDAVGPVGDDGLFGEEARAALAALSAAADLVFLGLRVDDLVALGAANGAFRGIFLSKRG